VKLIGIEEHVGNHPRKVYDRTDSLILRGYSGCHLQAVPCSAANRLPGSTCGKQWI
jgi:hypothetical protein